MTVAETTAIIMASVAILGMLYQWWRGRSEARRDNGDAAESVSNAARALIEPLTKRIADLETITKDQAKQIFDLTKRTREQGFEITELRAGVAILTNQIVALGHQPIYKPSPRGGESNLPNG